MLDAIKDTPPQGWLLDLGVAAGGILLGWLIARALCDKVPASRRWIFGKGRFSSVAIPLFALVFVWTGKHILANFQDVDILEIVDSILIAYTRLSATPETQKPATQSMG